MSKLYIVATPIGNLKDISLRALEILKKVDLIVAEDTRKTAHLLARYEIKKSVISYHQHSKIQKIDNIINRLKRGEKVALVSDAGTPGIADPGQILIKRAKQDKIDIIPIPGPQAAVAALSISGFPADRFLFLGFLPKKKGRQKLLKNLAQEKMIVKTMVLYESPYRILKTLKDLQDYLGDVEVVVGRELTKKFEEVLSGQISQVLPKIKPKGEFVICLKTKKD